MTDPREQTPSDGLARFTDRRFEGLCGHATATVDGALSLVEVHVEGPFHENTSACIRKAINYGLITARETLSRYLACESGLDLPPGIRSVLDGASAPEAHTPPHLRDYEADLAGVLVRIDGSKCLVTWVDVPTHQHLRLLPDVVNAALHAAESRHDGPPLAGLFESTWREIVGRLDDVDDHLEAIAAEHHDDA